MYAGHLLFVAVLISVLMSSCLTVIKAEESDGQQSVLFQTSLKQYNRKMKSLKNTPGYLNYPDWPMIAEFTSHMWIVQNDFHNKPIMYQNNFFVLIFDRTTWQTVKILENVLSNSLTGTSFLYFNLDDIKNNIKTINSLSYLRNIIQINSIFVITGNELSNSVLYLLNHVSSNLVFKWTSLIHTAEWIIVTTSPFVLETLVLLKNKTVDFITFITVIPEHSVTIAQKSRKKGFQVISRWPWFGQCTETSCCVSATRDSFIESIKRKIEFVYARGKLRANAMRYLTSQKSVLDGLRVPVSLFVTGADEKLVYNKSVSSKKGDSSNSVNISRTDLGGYCIDLLQLFAAIMGFTYEYLIVKDDGFYGTVIDDQRITGITGHLARREAAFSPMPLSMIDNRKGHIDYIPIPLTTGVPSFIYRLSGSDIDLTYIYIFKLDFLLLCLGPALIACVIGALQHVVTNSCKLQGPQRFSLQHLRRLTTFPDHICFQGSRYNSQSSRVLRASWSVMCLVCVSAFSAYLTRTFSVTSPELTIKTIDDLSAAKDYQFGLHEGLSALKTLLENSVKPAEQRLWTLLKKWNETDPRIISKNTSYHIKRVIAGKYVYLAPASFRANENQLPGDIRIYLVDDMSILNWDYISLPINTFYKEDFYKVIMLIYESKVYYYLRERYKIPIINKNYKLKESENKPIQFSRIELSLYVVLCGASISMVCLLGEIIYYRCFMKPFGRRINCLDN